MTINADRLKHFIDRIEEVDDEKRALAEQRKGVLDEAKSEGFDKKVLNAVVKLRAMKPADRSEQKELTELYCEAIGIA